MENKTCTTDETPGDCLAPSLQSALYSPYQTTDITKAIGQTPLVSLQKYPNIFVKLEGFNAFGSVKARVAWAMISAAEKAGILRPHSGQTILEASGGSTGWALCAIASLRGYSFMCVLPDNYSKERIRKLKAFGAKVRLSDHTKGNDSHFILARKLERENPSFYYIDQLSNPANPKIHYQTTGVEILNQLGKVDYFICGVGSGGTISGVGKRLKEYNPNCKVIAVQPEGCDVLNGHAIPHRIQGWGVGMIPKTFNPAIADGVLTVSYEQAIQECRNSFKQDGIYVGISSGANLFAAKKFGERLKGNPTVVTVAPDKGHCYLNENFLEAFLKKTNDCPTIH